MANPTPAREGLPELPAPDHVMNDGTRLYKQSTMETYAFAAIAGQPTQGGVDTDREAMLEWLHSGKLALPHPQPEKVPEYHDGAAMYQRESNSPVRLWGAPPPPSQPVRVEDKVCANCGTTEVRTVRECNRCGRYLSIHT